MILYKTTVETLAPAVLSVAERFHRLAGSRTRCDVLAIGFASRGRDVDIVEPILSYLEMRHGYKVVRRGVGECLGALLRYWPSTVIIANQGGAPEGHKAIRLAWELGFPTVALVSEGDYREDILPETFIKRHWGWNLSKVCCLDLNLQWSQVGVNLIRRHVPEYDDCEVRASGGTGFDKYAFRFAEERNQFIARRGRPGFGRVVGIAGWTFCKSHSPEKYLSEADSDEALFASLHRRAIRTLQEYYQRVVLDSPDVLFIFKQHPGAKEECCSEFYGLEEYRNVLVLKGNEESIYDVISACDMWLAYESTTCMEAWLAGRQTLLVNPEGPGFPRSDLHTGSPVATDYEDLAAALDAFYRTGEIPGFQELKSARKSLVAKKIGWSDGLNHVRAGEAVHQLVGDPPTHERRFNDFVKAEIHQRVRLRALVVSRAIRLERYGRDAAFHNALSSRFDRADRASQAERHRRCLRDFYPTIADDLASVSELVSQDCPVPHAISASTMRGALR